MRPSCPLGNLEELQLEVLDSEWMFKIFDAEFVECFELPPEYDEVLESVNLKTVFDRLIFDVDSWMSQNNPELDKSWSELSKTFEYKKLLALLFFAIDVGSNNIGDHDSLSRAIVAARLYYKLLTIPGFKAFNIYYSQLFIHSLACLKYPRNLCELEDGYYNKSELVRVVNRTIKNLGPYLEDLYLMILNLEPTPEDDIFEELVNSLIEITGAAIVTKINIDKYELSIVSRSSYQCIDLLLNGKDNSPNKTAITILFKCLLPKLISACMDFRVTTNVIRAGYVTYVGLLLARYGQHALPGFNTLLQHLCYTMDGLEKADVRQARVSLITGLMTLLTKKSYKSFVNWILKLSRTAKAPHRHLALEILSALLSNETSEVDQPVANVNRAPENGPIHTLSGLSDPQPGPSGISDHQPGTSQQFEPQPGPSRLSNSWQSQSHSSVNDPSPSTSGDQPKPSMNEYQLGNVSVSIESLSVSSELPNNHQSQTNSSIGELSSSLSCDKLKDLTSPHQLREASVTVKSLPINELNLEHCGIGSDVLLGSGTSAILSGEDYEFIQPESVPLVGAEANISGDPENLAITSNDVVHGITGPIEEEGAPTTPRKRKSNTLASEEIPQVKVPRSTEQDGDDLEDEVPLMNFVVHTVPHRELVRAIYERSFDVSSTVRTRALTILMQCVMNPLQSVTRAIKHINSEDSKLIKLAMRCMTDERAVVRKSAVTLIESLMKRDQDLINKNNLGVLVGLCRDTSLLVRSSAITALGECLTEWPSTCTLDSFLAGPLHQLSDPETKVQDLIIGQVKEILIYRLKKYSEVENYETALEWMFLSAITRHNMRRSLQKALALLSKKDDCVNNRLLDKIITHVDRNKGKAIEAMVLLSCVARHVECDSPNFLLQYYYELIKDEDAEVNGENEEDVRLTSLTLETLVCWSERIQGPARDELRTRLIREASEGKSQTRRNAAALAAHLDPKDLKWADSLLRACERACSEGCESGEWSRAADAALLSTVPPDPAFVQSLIDTVATFGDDQQESTVSARAAAVAALGRLCVRTRSCAVVAASALAKLLTSNDVPLPCRVNALLALTDICTRYTCIMEPLLEDICSCLSNAPTLLRRSAARALTRLLLGEFLRLRPPLYYRYCALLADPDDQVREPAEFYLTACLPNESIYHNFIECILVYNGCGSAEDATTKFDENLSFDSRQLIYDLMLQRMSLIQKFKFQCRLAQEIIGQAVDVTESGDTLNDNLESALKDTIYLLRCPDMRLPKKPTTNEATDINDLTARVTTNIVSQKMKWTVAEVLTPAVMKLYTNTGGTGQLGAFLVRLITDLLKDYRQEIEELIENDNELSHQVSSFQERIGEETFINRLHIRIADTSQEVQATPFMHSSSRGRRGTPHRSRGRPTAKRALALRDT